MGNQAAAQLQPQVVADIQDETGLTADQIRTCYKAFMADCETHRMSIDQETFKKQYACMFPKGDADSFARYVFNALDKDGSGRIDFQEFIMSISIAQNGSIEDKLAWAFDLFDLDGTGCISRTELVEMIKTLRSLRSDDGAVDEPAAEEMADHLLLRADTDNDKKLCKHEFTKGVHVSRTMQTLIEAAYVITLTPLQRKLTG